MSTLTTQETATEPRRVDYVAPRVNLHQNGEGYTLQADMPGVSREGVDITFEEGKLVIVGHRSAPETGKPERVYRESVEADYRRVFDLDPSIDPASISATIDQGLLVVRLQKSETAKPRKIAVG